LRRLQYGRDKLVILAEVKIEIQPPGVQACADAFQDP
jgi:hypothetical protein